MKKLSAFLALTLGILPVSVSADTCQSNTNSGNTVTQGSVTATNLNPFFIGSANGNPTMNFAPGGSQIGAFQFTLQSNQSFNSSLVNNLANSTGDAKTPIFGFSLSCVPYNTAFIPTPASYPYVAETNGIAGGTITIHEYKPTGAAVIVGTIALPSSAHGGPYVNTAVTRLANPYTPTAGSVFDAVVTTSNAGPNQYYQGCETTVSLQ